jgi:beta-glucosidase-like glycosyl hydrolase
VAVLAEKGLISGVYITSHNIVGSTAARLKEEISALQEKRRAAGLPPLIVAADQEGGIVSHQRNICTAVVEALNAGVDLLLVAFDGAQFYRIFTCAVAASAEGRLDGAMLGESEMRLKGAFPVD